MINLELYKIFYTVSEVGNITKASELLHISQPAVTKQIKNLETELNATLFIRTKKGVYLTECGNKIFYNVKQGLTLLQDIEKITQNFTNLEVGTIKIGTSTSLMKNFLLKYMETFHKDYPNIIVNIYTDPTQKLIEKLKHGQIDFIIAKFPKYLDNELNYTTLGKTRYILAGNQEFYDNNKKEIEAKNLANYPVLLQESPSNARETALKYFEENNLSITPKMNIASSNLLVDFLYMGYGIGFVTELYVKEELKKGRLYNLNIQPSLEDIPFGIISLKNNYLSHCCQKFIEYFKK